MKNLNNYRTLEKNLTINTRDIELHIEVLVDGKKIIDRKSDSLIGNFLKPLFSSMAGRLEIPQTSFVNYNAISGNNNTPIITNIDASGSDVVVTLLGSPGTESGFIQISGVETSSGTALNGVWEYSKPSGSSNDYTLLGSGSGGVYTNNGGFGQLVAPDNSGVYPGNRIFQSPSIVLSSSTDAIGIDDYFVEDQIFMSQNGEDNSLRAGNISIEAPFSDDSSSIFAISRTFTNVSDNTVAIRKAGLFTDLPVNTGAPDQTGMLIAQDFVSADLQPTETISINYKIRNATTPEGGILEQFNNILYTLLSGNQQNTQDIDGVNQPEWPDNHSIGNTLPFVAASVGVGNRFPFRGREDDWRVGPILGSANRSVKSTDYTLLDPSDIDSAIAHGTDPGQLYYYGAFVHDWQENPTSGIAQFTISRFFKNRSGGDVTVRQIGLNTGLYTLTASSILRQIYCISSNTLVADEVFADGDVGRVNIILSVEV